MLTADTQPRFIEKIAKDRCGREFRLVFLIAFVEGELKARLVSAEPLSRPLALKGECSGDVLCLPVACPLNETATDFIPAYTPVVSPYIELFFFTSQPTRAPSNF